MEEPVLLTPVIRLPDGAYEVRSPGVGWWSDHPHGGALLGAGSRVGFLDYQNRRFALVLPEGAAGRLKGAVPPDRRIAVEYGEALFRLSAVEAGQVEDAEIEGPARRDGDLPEGARPITAPTDGVFYRRPAPESPPFVEVGATIRTGQPIGLVEVMKTFNQIVYGGPGLPAEAEVLEIRAEEGAEIRSGDVLVVVR